MKADAQVIDQYNINIYSNLLSNHVYKIMKDHYGYLWIATDKGVAKYNGYELRNFDFAESSAEKDVWNLYEDKKGRMWLFSISDKLGYIYNNQYHSLVNNTPEADFYPRIIKDYTNGVIIVSTTSHKNSFYIERNDTIIKSINAPKNTYYVTSDDPDKLFTLDGAMMITRFGFFKNNFYAEAKQSLVNKICRRSLLNQHYYAIQPSFNKYVLSYKPGSAYLLAVDLKQGLCNKMHLDAFAKTKGERISMLSLTPDRISIITGKCIYTFDTGFRPIQQIFIDSAFKTSPEDKPSFYYADPFWSEVLATSTNGIFISYGTDTVYKKITNFDLTNFEYCGNSGDSICYWWNNSSRTLAVIKKNRLVTYSQYNLERVAKIIPYTKNTLLLLAQNSISVLNPTSLRTNSFFKNTHHFFAEKLPSDGRDFGYTDLIRFDNNEYYVITKRDGFYRMTFNGDSVFTSKINQDRFKGLAYDSTRKIIWAYNNHKIVICQPNKKSVTITEKELKLLGVNKVEKILIDQKYGNIFLQEGHHLLLYNNRSNTYRSLFDNFVMNDAKVYLNNNTLIVAGGFGILFSRVFNYDSLTPPIVYRNIKGVKYKVVYDAHISDKKLLIKTDKGSYLVKIPGDHAFKGSSKNYTSYKLILLYNNGILNVNSNDTINIAQENTNVAFDVINPHGMGAVKYQYKFGKGLHWNDMNANELNLPHLNPGEYNTLSLLAFDDQWRSNIVKLHVYIIPYWWQKPLVRKALWIAGIVLVLLLVYSIITVTKRIVIKKNEKKNLQLELELKSVYAQLNPHFIFNSLNAAQYLVKIKRLDEAYSHINRFSELLRSYIESSRNRLIKISDEITNLKNYIELQQTRFKNRFDYDIIVHDLVNTNASIPSLLLQPLVENAIIHGLLPAEQKGYLRIVFKTTTTENEIMCIIDDNGIGRDMSRKMGNDNVKKRRSYGGDIIRDLTKVFNKFMKMKIDIRYIDKELPETGTTIILHIKNTVQ